jgi:hypothetical protein
MFISILYMFWTAMCPSSEELIVSIRHLVNVTLYRRPFGMQVWMRSIFIQSKVIHKSVFLLCKWPTSRTNLFLRMFISILYMCRAAMCTSSEELNVSIRHLVYVTLYRWPFGVQVWMRSNLIQSKVIHKLVFLLCKWPNWHTIPFSCMFISILYIFRAAMCPSSGELNVSILHPVYVSLYGWQFSVHVWMRLQSHPNLHTRRLSIQSDIYQM